MTIPWNFKQYYQNLSQLKQRGHVSSGEQIASPVSAGSRGLANIEKFSRSPVQMMGDRGALKESVETFFTQLKEDVNVCENCGNLILSEKYKGGLRKWFKQKWVNIAKKKKGGGHPECGTSGSKRGYAKCVPASKARSMSKKQKKSAVTRKRAAQRKAGRGGKDTGGGPGKKPIRVSTKPKK